MTNGTAADPRRGGNNLLANSIDLGLSRGGAVETIQVVATKINPARILDIASPPASATS